MIVFVIAVMSAMLLALILFCRRALRKAAKQSMYSYRIISIAGLIIFLSLSLIMHIASMLYYVYFSELRDDQYLLSDIFSSIIDDYRDVISIVFIPVVVFAVFLFVSNTILLIKEKKCLAHVLGILLSVVIITGSVTALYLPHLINHWLFNYSEAGMRISLIMGNVFSVLVCYLECMMFATIYAAANSMRHKVLFGKKYVIILGCRVREDGQPGGILRKRVEAAIKFAHAQKRATGELPTLVFSGGKGSDEPISEAQSMHNYVIAQRYEGKIIIEDQSTTTRENFNYSKKLIGTTKDVAFATTDYHIFRSGVIATGQGYKQIEGIGAKSPWYYYYNALIREFIANLDAERKMHLSLIGILIFIQIAIVIISSICGII